MLDIVYRREVDSRNGLLVKVMDGAKLGSRDLLISRTELRLTGSLNLIRTLVAVSPMLGLLGTVTGMIDVFNVMAGGGCRTHGMAEDDSGATLPTMAGMVAAISGMLFSTQLDQFAEGHTAQMQDHLDIVHGED